MRAFADLIEKIDLLLFLPALLLTSFGLLMIYSVSFESDASFFFKHLFHSFESIVIFLIVARINFNSISRFTFLFYFLVVVLLIATLFLGEEVRGAIRWIDLGVVTIQASEIAKAVLVLTLSIFLAKNPPTSLKNLAISILIVAVPVFLILRQPDLGNSFILLSIWAFIIFVAGLKWSHLLAGILGFAFAVPFLWNFLRDYQRVRILSFFNPEADPQGASYNVVQALIAFGSGQLMGRGLGRGTQSHLNFLPADSTDFIFASTGEELGFLGIGIMIVLLIFLIYRLVKIATSIKNPAGVLFTFGAAFTIFIQFFVNAGVNMGFIPVTGITLPFVSFGGSSLISIFILLGLVNSIENTFGKKKFDTVFDS